MEQTISFTMNPSEFSDFLRVTIREEVGPLIDKISQKMPGLPENCTRREAAEILRISLPTVDKMAKNGTLTAKRVQGRIRFERSEIENALKEVKNLRYKRK